MGPGISLGYYKHPPPPQLPFLEPKETPNCLIPCLLVVFSQQLETLVTTLIIFIIFRSVCVTEVKTIVIYIIADIVQLHLFSFRWNSRSLDWNWNVAGLWKPSNIILHNIFEFYFSLFEEANIWKMITFSFLRTGGYYYMPLLTPKSCCNSDVVNFVRC